MSRPQLTREMTRRLTILVLAIALGAACKTNTEPVPAWVTTLISQLENEPVANPPAFLARYDYGGRIVYYLPARCCDIASSLYDIGGVVICHPDGGFTGNGDGRCPDFFARRTNESIVWRDPRGAA